MDDFAIDLSQPLKRAVLIRNPSAFSRPIPHLVLIMEDQQELKQGVWGGPRPIDQAQKTGVPSKHPGILDALAPAA